MEKTDDKACFVNIKVLYCASTTSHLRNFHLPYIQWLNENGFKVTTLTDDGQILPFVSKSEKSDFTKKLLSLQNIKSIFKIKKFLLNNNFNLIITNTTLAGAVVRASVRLLSKSQRPKVLHICHGFLFNDNDGIKKQLLILPERICAKITDVFSTMNKESHTMAEKYKLGKKVVFTSGMGINIDKFNRAEPISDTFNFVYVADFSKRKNQAELIRAFAKTIDKMPNSRLVFAGDGKTINECRQLVNSLNIEEYVKFLGYVKDVPSLLAECDVAISSSRYEGLPFNIMEAMAAGLPVIASDIAGHCDLLEKVELYHTEADLEDKLIVQYHLGRRRIYYKNLERYTLENVFQEWINIYENLICNYGSI